LGDGIFDTKTGHYYVAIQSGISGKHNPTFFVPAPQIVQDNPKSTAAIEWEDLGTTSPTSHEENRPKQANLENSHRATHFS
jgi:hypothetical protein